jgi:hypothetical protein
VISDVKEHILTAASTVPPIASNSTEGGPSYMSLLYYVLTGSHRSIIGKDLGIEIQVIDQF